MVAIMKKLFSPASFKNEYIKKNGRIILYGAGKRGKVIADLFNQFDFKITAFIDKNPENELKKNNEYKFISLSELKKNDHVFITPENFDVQKEIELILQDYQISNYYYFDCNWRWYDLLEANFEDDENKYTNVEEFEKEYKSFRQIYETVNIYTMWATRIGELVYRFQIMHLALNKNSNQYDLIIPDTQPGSGAAVANQRLMDMFGRYLNIINNKNSSFWKLVFLWHASELSSKKVDYYDSYCEKQISLWKQPYANTINFTKMELNEAKSKFKRLKIEQEFVCIHARDSYYLEHQFNYDKKFWNYHNYRDFSISKYNKLVDYLEQKNITSVRVGRNVKEKYNNKNVIDFPINYYDELLDIYLSANCKYYISTMTGVINMAHLFSRKTIIINVSEMVLSTFTLNWRKDEIFITKLYYSKSRKRFMTIKEMLNFDFKKLQIEPAEWLSNSMITDIIYIENTEDDILDAYIEAEQRFEKKWQDDEEEKKLQQKYSEIIKKFCKENPFCGKFHNRPIEECIMPINISSTFLKKNRFLVEGK